MNMDNNTLKIAIYGKGGIGKSTIASNLTAAFTKSGRRVMQIGCDPKRDSTRNLLEGRLIPTVLERLRVLIEQGKTEKDLVLDDVVFQGFNNAICIEAGGPEPGIGCAGRGIITAINILRNHGAIASLQPDIIVYDVLGDVVCGGFAQPIREGFAEKVYMVCSAELMSLYAANNIAKAIKRHAQTGKSRLAGVICNARGDLAKEVAVLEKFASQLNTRLIGAIPRSKGIQEAESNGKTVVQEFPDSDIARSFEALAARIWENRHSTVPTPMELYELEALFKGYLMTLSN